MRISDSTFAAPLWILIAPILLAFAVPVYAVSPSDYDTFTATNGTAISSHTLDSGGSWTAYGTSGTTPTIQSNEAQTTADGSGNFYTGCSSIGTMSGAVKLYTDGIAGLIFRLSDANNNFVIWPDTNSNTLRIYKVEAGVTTSLTSGAFSVTAGAAYTLSASFSGSTISASLNGTTISTTSTFNQTASNCGFRLYRGGSAAGNASLDTFTVYKKSTNTTLTSSANPSLSGSSILLRGTVAPGAATGTLTFKNGSTTLGTATLGNGSGTLTTVALAEGSHSLTVIYAGNMNYATSTSSTLTQTMYAIPQVSSLSPSDNATGVSASADLVLTFNETVRAGTGSLTIKKSSDDTTVETITVSGALLSGNGSTEITLNPSTTLAESTSYYITWTANAFKDATNIHASAVTSSTYWNFTTAASASSNSGGGGSWAYWLLQLRQKNGLNINGYASLPSQTSAVPAIDSFDTLKPASPSTTISTIPLDSPLGTHPEVMLSPLQIRVCARVTRTFAKAPEVVKRLNRRLQTRFGFTCN